MYELNQALIFKIAQIIVQEPLVPPTQVQLGFLPTLPLMHYSRFYHCAAAVVSGDYRIYFSERVLKARSFGADQQLNQILSNQAQQSLRASDSLEYRQQQLKQRIWGLIAQAFREKMRFCKLTLHSKCISPNEPYSAISSSMHSIFRKSWMNFGYSKANYI